ncbi:MAG: sulfatase [Actinobacteria bacterium]|nr:sulfatase [Actinomycetota bacterium]
MSVRVAVSSGLAVVAIASSVAFLPDVGAEVDARPNVIVIVTDDQPADTIPRLPAVMPFLQARALDPGDHWVVFERAFVNTPICCPSRATMLSGFYAHHTGVLDNDDGHAFDESSTLATWLRDAGYHTGLVGKYLNLYPFGRDPFVPQGWDRWWGKIHGPPTTLYHDYTLFEQDHTVDYGTLPADYSTDVLASKAVEFIQESPLDRPFLLWYAPTAPHPPAIPAERHAGAFDDLVVPMPPSVGEADVSDKPAWVRALPRLDAQDFDALRRARRRSSETLLAVDEAVRRIVALLRARGELDETVIVITSDNGLAFGEHRWTRKSCPYEVCLRVPFLVRVPDVEHRVERTVVSAADLAPTIAELAGIVPPLTLDGVSLVDLLRSGSRAGLPGVVFAELPGDQRVPAWWELRGRRFAYVELVTGERELYDLRGDPFELVNVVDDARYADDVERLAAALDVVRNA